MLEINDRELWKLERDLNTYAKRAAGFASRDALNFAAFNTQAAARERIRREMINRNQFTVRSVLVDRAKSSRIAAQEAIVGSIAPYMATQEFGGRTAFRGDNQTRIPTSFAAGQDGSKPRTKLPTSTNKFRNIKLRRKVRKGKFASNVQKRFLTALVAARDGERFVYLEGGTGGHSGTGIYRVWGRNKVRGQYRGVKTRMVYNMSRSPRRIPKNPWLTPSVREVEKTLPSLYAVALRNQAQRWGLFGS